jgi:Uma2 family endonuclease
MAAHAQPRMTPEEYLAFDRASELRHEYYGGVMYAMSGGSHVHAYITTNLSSELRSALKGSPCGASAVDLRVKISARSYVYPDVVVVCGEPRYADGEADILLNPSLIVEVLSPSTERYDRGPKSAWYRTIESLKEYALVSQSEPRVEVYRRQASGEWLLSEAVGLEASCHFDGLKNEPVRIPLSEIYERVEFGTVDAILPSEPTAS